MHRKMGEDVKRAKRTVCEWQEPGWNWRGAACKQQELRWNWRTGVKPAMNHTQMVNQGRMGEEPYENGELEWNQQELYVNSRNRDETGELEWNQQQTIWKRWTRGYLAKRRKWQKKNWGEEGPWDEWQVAIRGQTDCKMSSKMMWGDQRMCDFWGFFKLEEKFLGVEQPWDKWQGVVRW